MHRSCESSAAVGNAAADGVKFGGAPARSEVTPSEARKGTCRDLTAPTYGLGARVKTKSRPRTDEPSSGGESHRGMENRRPRKRTVGSNPTPSANVTAARVG